MSASIKKKVSQNRTKLQQTTNNNKQQQTTTNNNKQQQTTNNKRPFFLPKINKVFLRPILQNLKGRSVLDKFFFENDPLDEPNQMPPSKKFYLLSKLVKNAKWWSKSSLPLSHSTAKFFPLKKGFKKVSRDFHLNTVYNVFLVQNKNVKNVFCNYNNELYSQHFPCGQRVCWSSKQHILRSLMVLPSQRTPW